MCCFNPYSPGFSIYLLTIKRSNKEFRTNINRITRISKKVQQKNHKIKYDTQELLDILIDDVDNDRAVFKYLDFLTYTSDKGVDYILKLIEVLTRDLYCAEVGIKIFKIRTGSQYFKENYVISHKELKIILLDLLKTYFKESFNPYSPGFSIYLQSKKYI